MFLRFLVVLLLLLVSVFTSDAKQLEWLSNGNGYRKRVAAVIDAGSSGSRMHFYDFGFHDDHVFVQQRKPTSETFAEVLPGLGTLAFLANGSFSAAVAAESLRPLLDFVSKSENGVPLVVGATAGLRMLGTDHADDILRAVRTLIETEYKTHFGPVKVLLLDGREEGT
jgi:Golgi nucleoside diphosphatase